MPRQKSSPKPANGVTALVSFQYLAESSNVTVNADIQLVAHRDTVIQNNQVVLDAINWQWPVGDDVLGTVVGKDIDFRISHGTTFYIIVDAIGNRVIELTEDADELVWEFYKKDTADPKFLRYPTAVHSFEVNGQVKYMITDQLRHRVIIVDRDTKAIEWTYGDETPGDGFNQLNSPADAMPIDLNRVLICDQGNNRVIIISKADTSVLASTDTFPNEEKLKVPVDADWVPETRQVLITDQKNHRVVLLDSTLSTKQFQFGLTGKFVPASDSTQIGLYNPTDADYLPNGNISICDSSNKRLIEVNLAGDLVWQHNESLRGLIDADRLPTDSTLVLASIDGVPGTPARLGYATQTIFSELIELPRSVNLLNLFMEFGNSQSEGVKVQIRSAKPNEDIVGKSWYGPTSKTDFYTSAFTPINPVHIGISKYQYKILLETDSPLYTPVINSLSASNQYFNTDSTGRIVTESFGRDDALLVSNWDSLVVWTKLPTNSSYRQDVQIEIQAWDASTQQPVLNPLQINQFVTKQTFALSNSGEWLGNNPQKLELRANLVTSNASVTPILDKWAVYWTATNATSSQIQFVNRDNVGVTYYYTSTELPFGDPNYKYIDQMYILLNDENLAVTQSKVGVSVSVTNQASGDSAAIVLEQLPSGYFKNPNGIGLVITDIVDRTNQVLEVMDRDTLEVTYIDPADETDVQYDKVVIVQNTQAQIQIEDSHGMPVDSVAFGDSIYVRITNELDMSLDPELRESLQVSIYDNNTNDIEYLSLYEQPDLDGRYHTGIFVSETGIPVTNNSIGVPRDRRLQTQHTNQIGISYDDQWDPKPVVSLSVQAIGDTTATPFSGLYSFEIAPNPYYADIHDGLRMRMISSIGDLTLNQIEIFNLAGILVRTIPGNNVFTNSVPQDVYAVADAWWDLRNENQTPIASGTYWVKFNATLVDAANGTSQNISALEKLVIIR